MKITGRSLFSLFITVLMLIMIIQAFEYNPKARSIPITVGALIFVMAFLQLLGELFPSVQSKLPFLQQKGILTSEETSKETPLDAEEAKDEPDNEENEASWTRIGISFIWLIGFIILLYFTTYLLAVPVFIFLFIRFVGKAKVLPSLSIAIGMAIFMYVLFDLFLGARF